MKIPIEYLKLGLSRDLDGSQVQRAIYDYKNARVGAAKCGWRDEEGNQCKKAALDIEKRLKPVITTLLSIDSSNFYPAKVQDGKIIKNREMMYKYLIKELS